MSDIKPKDIKALWGFAARYGSKNANWGELIKTGKLSEQDAKVMINMITGIPALETDQEKDTQADMIASKIAILPGMDDFTVETYPSGREPEPAEKIEVKPEQTPEPEPTPEPEEPEETPEPVPPEPVVPGEVQGLMDTLKKVLSGPIVEAIEKKLNELEHAHKQVTELQEKIDQLEKEPKQAIPVIEIIGDTDYIKPHWFDRAAAILNNDDPALLQNLLLTGPAGCGKSRAAKEIAKTMGLEFFSCSMGGGLRYAQTFGSDQLDPETGGSFWRASPMIEAMQKPSLILLDEILTCDPGVINGMNQILETGSRAFLSPIGELKVHEKTVFVGTSNGTGREVSDQHSAIERQDDALLDRFVTMPVDYCDTVESKITLSIKDGNVRNWVRNNLKKLRTNIQTHNIRFDPSTRRLKECIINLAKGFTTEDAFELAFLSNLTTPERIKAGFPVKVEEAA